MFKLLPLKGPDSYWALQSYGKLLLGLKMLPMYMGQDLEEFFGSIEAMPIEDRQSIVRQAVVLVQLDKNSGEFESLMQFVADKNGVPLRRENLNGLDPNEVFDALHLVTQAIAALEPRFLSLREKKN